MEPEIRSTRLQSLKGYVDHFEPISLQEIECVALMDRTDLKYMLPFKQLEPVIRELDGKYRILTIGSDKVFSYRTEYFDTPDLHMYLEHQNDRLKRFKVRQREYIESKISFLEVKYKSNKGRIIKIRVQTVDGDTKLFNGFVTENTPYNPLILKRKLTNYFNRFTLVDYTMQERITTDINITFTDGIHWTSLTDTVVIEVKQDFPNRNTPICQSLKKYLIRPVPMSKYCIGTSLLNPLPKSNNFKPIIKQINKFGHVERIS